MSLRRTSQVTYRLTGAIAKPMSMTDGWKIAGKLLESSLFWDVYDVWMFWDVYDVWMVSNGQTIYSSQQLAYPMADQSKKRTARNVNSTWPTSGTVELSFFFL
jgi:hypothetical protein